MGSRGKEKQCAGIGLRRRGIGNFLSARFEAGSGALGGASFGEDYAPPVSRNPGARKGLSFAPALLRLTLPMRGALGGVPLLDPDSFYVGEFADAVNS